MNETRATKTDRLVLLSALRAAAACECMAVQHTWKLCAGNTEEPGGVWLVATKNVQLQLVLAEAPCQEAQLQVLLCHVGCRSIMTNACTGLL